MSGGAHAALAVLVCVGIAYVSGSLPFGLWLGRIFRGVDVRTLGSRNIGATNVYRTLGPGLGIATLILDALKGALPVIFVPRLPIAASFPGGEPVCALAVGLAAVAGHVWTCFAGFRGGKGVATAVGVLAGLSLPAFGVFVAVFVAAVAATRFISVGSMLGAIAFAVTLAVRDGVRSPRFGFGVLLAALVIVRHRENLGRLARGEERRFSFKRSASGAA